LHALRVLVDSDWRKHLEQELKWLAGTLGSVRDLDILGRRLRSASESMRHVDCLVEKAIAPPNGELEPLFDDLRERHAKNSRGLRDALLGQRYRNLLLSLESSIADPAFAPEAWEPCGRVLPRLAREAWRRLKNGGRDLDTRGPDTDFHEVRKSAKRARYTAELIAPALGRRAERQAKRFIRLTTRIQDVLGEHQDAIVATAEIERFLARVPQTDGSSRAARELLEAQAQAAGATREEFFAVWKKLDRKKSLRWFRERDHVKA
jgi:CHAD domain-containing protein